MTRIRKIFLGKAFDLVGSDALTPNVAKRVKIINRCLKLNNFDRAYNVSVANRTTRNIFDYSVIGAQI